MNRRTDAKISISWWARGEFTTAGSCGRLEGCTEWHEFPAAYEMRPVLGGFGNVDRFTAVFPNGSPFEGMTMRFFDPKTRQWSIYWVDDWTCQLQPPVVGHFTANRGEFLGEDTFNDKRIRVRYIWLKKSANLAHWAQAFSEDGEQTWETNWEMEFTRE